MYFPIGLSQLLHLRVLDIQSNCSWALTPLSNLIMLEELHMLQWTGSDITPLAKCKNLTNISLPEVDGVDVAVISSCTQLRIIYMGWLPGNVPVIIASIFKHIQKITTLTKIPFDLNDNFNTDDSNYVVYKFDHHILTSVMYYEYTLDSMGNGPVIDLAIPARFNRKRSTYLQYMSNCNKRIRGS
jgi:hypothetical protein